MTSALRYDDKKEPDIQGSGEESSKQREQQRPVTDLDKCIQRTERRPVQKGAMVRGRSLRGRQGRALGLQKESGFHSSSSASQNLCPKKIKWPHDLEIITF